MHIPPFAGRDSGEKDKSRTSSLTSSSSSFPHLPQNTSHPHSPAFVHFAHLPPPCYTSAQAHTRTRTHPFHVISPAHSCLSPLARPQWRRLTSNCHLTNGHPATLCKFHECASMRLLSPLRQRCPSPHTFTTFVRLAHPTTTLLHQRASTLMRPSRLCHLACPPSPLTPRTSIMTLSHQIPRARHPTLTRPVHVPMCFQHNQPWPS
jgi:hypothetical protein